MSFLQVSKLSHSFGPQLLLDDVSFTLSNGDKIALAGGNGSGKTTLLKILAQFLTADRGQIICDKESSISYLPQAGIVHTNKTLFEEAELSFSHASKLLEKKSEIEELLADSSQKQDLEKLLFTQHALEEAISHSGYYEREARIEQVLKGLGFLHKDLNRDVGEFSGGWQMRIALAKILLENSSIMLLDEPTNYLDLETREWLEDYLKNYQGTLIVVSHDRFFLDSIVTAVMELFKGKLSIYKGNYTEYEQNRQIQIELLLKRWQKQQEEIAQTERFIERFRAKATKASQVQSRVKQLDKIEIIEIPDNLQKMKINFPKAPHSGKKVVKLDSLNKSYGKLNVIQELSFELDRHEKVVVVGRNGAGKSTLMRIIAGVDKDYSGSVQYGSGVQTGYFSQDIDLVFTKQRSIIEELETGAPTHLIPQLRDMLGAFLFRGDDIYKNVQILSGGEKNRLALLKMLLSPFNLLLLDEPTNHLDLHSKDILLDALKRFDGTILFVSHDRHFIDNLATKVLELSPQGYRIFHGDYPYYLWKIHNEAEQSCRPEETVKTGSLRTDSQKDREKTKDLQRKLRQLERQEESLLEEIDFKESEIEQVKKALTKPENYSNGEIAKSLQSKLEKKTAELGTRISEWEVISTELHGLLDKAF